MEAINSSKTRPDQSVSIQDQVNPFHFSRQGTKLQTKKKNLSMLSTDIKVTQSITQECQIFPGPSPYDTRTHRPYLPHKSRMEYPSSRLLNGEVKELLGVKLNK